METTSQSPKEPPKRDQIKDVEQEERTHHGTKVTDIGINDYFKLCLFSKSNNIFLIQETQGQWQKGKQQICQRKNLMKKTKTKLLNRKVQFRKKELFLFFQMIDEVWCICNHVCI